MTNLRKYMFESLKRENPKRPLIWYALGLQNSTNVPGGYFGFSTEKGAIYLDSTVHTSLSNIGKYQDSLGLKWVRWKVDSNTGKVDYSKPNWLYEGFYNPLIRDWYIQAQAFNGDQVTFLKPYAFAVGGKQGLGIGSVVPLYNKGVFKGVIDCEYDIMFLSQLLTTQREATNGLIFIFDRTTKKIVAISNVSQLVKYKNGKGSLYIVGSSHPNELVRLSGDKFRTGGSLPYKGILKHQETSYQIYAIGFNAQYEMNVYGLDWVVVTIWASQCKPNLVWGILCSGGNFSLMVITLVCALITFIFALILCLNFCCSNKEERFDDGSLGHDDTSSA